MVICDMSSLDGWEPVIGTSLWNVVFVSFDGACRFLQLVLLSVINRAIENTDMVGLMRGTPGVVWHQEELDGEVQYKKHTEIEDRD
jgi:hypothetical protein